MLPFRLFETDGRNWLLFSEVELLEVFKWPWLVAEGAEKATHSRGDRQTRYLDAASAASFNPSFAEGARATLSHPPRQLLLLSSSVNWR
jgi:hypothetical protein